MGRVLLPCGAYVNLDPVQEKAYYNIQYKIDRSVQPGPAKKLINIEIQRINAAAQQARLNDLIAQQKLAKEKARQFHELKKQKALQAQTQQTIVNLTMQVNDVATTNVALTKTVEEQTQTIQKLEKLESDAAKETAAIKELLRTLESKLDALALQETENKEESQKLKDALISFEKKVLEDE